VVGMCMTFHGIVVAFMYVSYVPRAYWLLREHIFLYFLPLPTMRLAVYLPQKSESVLTFEGYKLMTFQMASLFLSKEVDGANFLFACAHHVDDSKWEAFVDSMALFLNYTVVSVLLFVLLTIMGTTIKNMTFMKHALYLSGPSGIVHMASDTIFHMQGDRQSDQMLN
ncbi:TPA: hypothetical protein N0F65_004584, partial [Lagenidium giganteum]